jgi:GNAT superfamily N-acetyltransferase
MEFSSPTADEYDFLYDSWILSFKKSPFAGCVPNSLWFDTQRATIREVLDRGATVLVASTPISGREAEYPAVRRVMGYVVAEPAHKVLHWLYVKNDYRGMGIGSALLRAVSPSGEWEYSHRTKASAGFLGSRFHWNPVTARVKELR